LSCENRFQRLFQRIPYFEEPEQIYGEENQENRKGREAVSYSSEEKTIILTVVVALVIISALLVNLMLTPIPSEKFSTIYYLDAEKGQRISKNSGFGQK
jgi:uncharacterized membrane protein